MKFFIPHLYLLSGLIILSCTKATAQQNLSDSAFYQTALHNTIAIYHNTLADQSALYSGRLNLPYPYAFKEGEPYFQSSLFRTGSVLYDGILYDSVSLLHDELAGLLIIFLPGSGRVQLANERIKSFTIEGSKFVKMDKDSLQVMPTGFYQLLYPGKTTVLKRNFKYVKETPELSEGVTRFVLDKEYYYVKTEGWHRVKSKRALLALFPAEKKQLQQFIKANKLSFKPDMTSAIASVAAYHDQLTK